MDYSKTRHSLRIILMLAACALLAAGCFQLAQPVPPADLKEYMEKEGSTPIVFSCPDGFYSDSLSLELEAVGTLPEGAEIRYTMDGTDPDRDSELYQGPILLRAGENAHEGERERYAYGASADPGSGEADDATASEGAGQDGEAAASPASADYAVGNPAAGTTAFTVRARLFCGEDAADVQYGVYCVGTGLLPFENGYIVCIDTDPEGLYDYDTGILVGGRDLDENNGSKYHGNYMQKGGEWVRACRVAVFDGDGTLLVEKNAGLAVSGGMSRRLDQKSFNLSAESPLATEDEKTESAEENAAGDSADGRAAGETVGAGDSASGEEAEGGSAQGASGSGDQISDDGHFYLDIFPDYEEAVCAHVGKYTHLRLRARSQVPRTFRETLVEQLAEESGVLAAASPRPGIVFLNGDFYTLAELEPAFSSSFLEHRFDLPDTEHIEKKKGKESSVFRKLDLTDLFAADLTKAENRDALEAAVDMEDYLLMYAFNILTNNLDWPCNNVEAWRYTGGYDPDRPYTDGRIRFLIFDSDKAFNADPDLADDFGTDNLASIMNNVRLGRDSAFPNVMKAEYYRNMFFTILCDLMNTSFEPSHLEALIREDYGSLEDEIRAFFTEDYRAQIEESYEGALAMAASRGAAVRDDLETWFGLSDMYRLEIAAGEGVHVTWDRRVLSPEGTYEGTYYTGIPVTFTAVAAPGWRFDHWEVDGEVYIPEEETYAGDIDGAATLTIDGGADTLDVDGGDDSLAIDGGDDLLDVDGGIATLAIDGETAAGGTCTVRAVAVREEGGCLIISEVSADGDDDWITLCNAGTTDVDLGQYCLSDDSENPQKFRLPAVSLAPGETCRINGKKNDSAGALCACTFSLSDGETLTLTPDEGIGAPGDSLRIPRMAAGCFYGRRDKGNLWCWFDRRQEP